MRATLLVLASLAFAFAFAPTASADNPCGPNVQRCEPFDPCRYDPHDPLESPVQWVLCGDAEDTVEALLGGVSW